MMETTRMILTNSRLGSLAMDEFFWKTEELSRLALEAVLLYSDDMIVDLQIYHDAQYVGVRRIRELLCEFLTEEEYEEVLTEEEYHTRFVYAAIIKKFRG